jgi:hypothetical protein
LGFIVKNIVGGILETDQLLSGWSIQFLKVCLGQLRRGIIVVLPNEADLPAPG